MKSALCAWSNHLNLSLVCTFKMSVRKLPTGKWLCECYPYGAAGKRIRKQFVTKGEALSYERRLMNSNLGSEFQDGSGPRLSELVARWFEMYGKTLSSGEERRAKLEAICSRLGIACFSI